MNNPGVNIISFNIPYPANYGGVIDVFYKIKAFNDLGVNVILHCFEYGRDRSEVLESMCDKVYYYKRRGALSNLSHIPYIVNSRKSSELLKNLLANDLPIIMEGMHSTFLIGNKFLEERCIIYRESNIEHEYYSYLSKAEKSLFKKLYFIMESFRLKRYEKVMNLASQIWAVSKEDKKALEDRLGHKKVYFLPSFKGFDDVKGLEGRGDYVLYHANLSVPENDKAAHYLIDNVFSKINTSAIIAGLKPNNALKKKISNFENISLLSDLEEDEMNRLIRDAHIHVLHTSQASGLKLKLLNVLFNGRHCLANDLMLHGSGLDHLCEIANTPTDYIKMIENLMKKDFGSDDVAKREKILVDYTDKQNANRAKSFLKTDFVGFGI